MRSKNSKSFLVVLFGGLVCLIIGCGGASYSPTPIPSSALEPTEIETGETAKLILRINLGETHSRALNPGERSTLTATQKKKINKIHCSLSNQKDNYYYRNDIDINPDVNAVVECAFADIKPCAYRLYVNAQQCINDYTHTLFEHQAEVIIIDGINEISVPLTLCEWQPVTLSLPKQYMGEEKGFFAEGEYRNSVGSAGFGSWFALRENKTSLVGTIPLGITGKMEMEYRTKRYIIDANVLLSALINDRLVPLSECQWELITSATLTVGFTANYAVVPTDYPSIQAAINTVQPGTTIKLNPGTYNESIVLKPGIRIEGNSSDPYGYVIQSDVENTVSGETGWENTNQFEAEICGITIRNTYENILNYKNWTYAAVFCNLGFDVKMDHCIVESLGIGDCVAGNYSRLTLTNITLIGNNIKDVCGIATYNTSSGSNEFKNLIFFNTDEAVRIAFGDMTISPVKVVSSIFWNTKFQNVIFSETNCDGNPEFLDEWWNKYTPSSEGATVKAVMERDKSGNYPGALMPQKPPTPPLEEDGGKG